jgi:hypothetical protein
MTNPPNAPNPDLDYANRCINYLMEIRQQIPPTERFYTVISMAIEIFELYVASLPEYRPPLSSRMPPSDTKK